MVAPQKTIRSNKLEHCKLDLDKSSNNNTAKQAVNMDNIFPYLDVCNNNLSQDTFDWLSKVSGYQIGMTVAAYDYGVFVSVPINEDEEQLLISVQYFPD